MPPPTRWVYVRYTAPPHTPVHKQPAETLAVRSVPFFPGENHPLVRPTHHLGRPVLPCGCAFHLAVFLDVYAVFPVHVPQTVGRDQIDVNCALFVLLQFSHLYVACPWREDHDPLGIGASLCARIARTHYMRVWARVPFAHRKKMDPPPPPSLPRVSCSPSVTVPLTAVDTGRCFVLCHCHWRPRRCHCGSSRYQSPEFAHQPHGDFHYPCR